MTTTDTIPTFEKSIRYDRETRDYACYLDGELVCFARTYHEAEITLDQLVYELLVSGITATATELDGGASVEAIADEYAALPLPLVADPIGECYVCGDAAWECNVHGPLCPSHAAVYVEWQTETNPPLSVDALLDEADAALAHCPGAFEPCGAPAHPSYTPFCQRCADVLDRLRAAALAEPCEYCQEPHAPADCPLHKPLIQPGPRACGCCGGAHSIQDCPDIRTALFAADAVFYAVAA